jgi:hypothetical protein
MMNFVRARGNSVSPVDQKSHKREGYSRIRHNAERLMLSTPKRFDLQDQTMAGERPGRESDQIIVII